MYFAEYFASCADAVSLLPKLEPMAGAALAINLAYLNLGRFRYRTSIRKHARAELERLRTNEKDALPSEVLDNKWYKEVERLAALTDNDPISDDSPKKKKAEFPHGIWGLGYKLVFEHHQDRAASMIITGFSIIAFIIGTAHSIGSLQSVACWFTYDSAVVFLWILSSGVVAPMIFVLCGSKVSQWARKYAEENVTELEKAMQGGAKRAMLKAESESS